MASRYVDALVAELKMRCREIDMASIHTLYIGGGTPSFLPPSLLEKLCGAVADYVDWRQLDEATIEVNPEEFGIMSQIAESGTPIFNDSFKANVIE